VTTKKKLKDMTKAELYKEVVRARSMLGKRDKKIAADQKKILTQGMEIITLTSNNTGLVEELDRLKGNSIPLKCEWCSYFCTDNSELGYCAHDAMGNTKVHVRGEPPTQCPLRKKEEEPEPPACVPSHCKNCSHVGNTERLDPCLCMHDEVTKHYLKGRDAEKDTFCPPDWCPLRAKKMTECAKPRDLPTKCGLCMWGSALSDKTPICIHPDEKRARRAPLIVPDAAPPIWCAIRKDLVEEHMKKVEEQEWDGPPQPGWLVCEDCEAKITNEKVQPGGFIEIEGDILCAKCAQTRVDHLTQVVEYMDKGGPAFKDGDEVLFRVSEEHEGATGVMRGTIRGQVVKNQAGLWSYTVCTTMVSYTDSDIVLKIAEPLLVPYTKE